MFYMSFEASNSMFYSSQAYNAFIEKNGPEQVLPELNMTSKELFFIGYAQVNNTKILSILHCVSLDSQSRALCIVCLFLVIIRLLRFLFRAYLVNTFQTGESLNCELVYSFLQAFTRGSWPWKFNQTTS